MRICLKQDGSPHLWQNSVWCNTWPNQLMSTGTCLTALWPELVAWDMICQLHLKRSPMPGETSVPVLRHFHKWKNVLLPLCQHCEGTHCARTFRRWLIHLSLICFICRRQPWSAWSTRYCQIVLSENSVNLLLMPSAVSCVDARPNSWKANWWLDNRMVGYSIRAMHSRFMEKESDTGRLQCWPGH